MDRRQKKTREAIFRAFSELLEIKRYENITVQEIIDRANIGRSTFYAHFETKDELLRALCTEIFHHVFTEQLPLEHDPRWADGANNLELKLGHVLYHLKENSVDIKGIVTADGDGLFMQYLKQYLADLFRQYSEVFDADVPDEFLVSHLVGSFAEIIKWWISEDMKTSSEQVAQFYMSMLRTE